MSEALTTGRVRRWECLHGQTVTLYHADCMDVLPVKADLLLTDPPYGISYDTNTGKHQGNQLFEMIHDDDKPFNPLHLMDWPDVILWGVNNYCNAIPPKIGQWYFWDKVIQNDLNVRISEGEFAWHKQGTKPRAFRHLWSGAYRESEAGERALHATQKPVALMAWCMKQAKLPIGTTVLDPYMGSGTTGIACIRTGRSFIGIEIDRHYFEVACDRVNRELDGMLL